jgi:hypothetical protein
MPVLSWSILLAVLYSPSDNLEISASKTLIPFLLIISNPRRFSLSSVADTALERNKLLRATWQAEYGDIPADYFVWLDKLSVDDHTNQCTDGWAAIGHACVCHATFIRGQPYSILPALTSDGIVALDIFKGSMNKEKLIRF